MDVYDEVKEFAENKGISLKNVKIKIDGDGYMVHLNDEPFEYCATHERAIAVRTHIKNEALELLE